MSRQRTGPGDARHALHDGVSFAVNGLGKREAIIVGRGSGVPKRAADGKGDIAVANNITVGDLILGKIFFFIRRHI